MTSQCTQVSTERDALRCNVITEDIDQGHGVKSQMRRRRPGDIATARIVDPIQSGELILEDLESGCVSTRTADEDLWTVSTGKVLFAFLDGVSDSSETWDAH